MGVEVLGRQMIVFSWQWSGKWGGDDSQWELYLRMFPVNSRKMGPARPKEVNFKYENYWSTYT